MNKRFSLLSLISWILRPTVLSSSRALQLSIALLRVVAGVVMVHNGLNKLGNVESFAEAYVSVIGLPFPIFFTYVAAFTELLAAPMLAIGLLTRPAALGLVSTMLVAVYHHIKVAGLSIPYLELSLLYAACFQFFLVSGAGLFSIDALVVGWIDNAIGNPSRQPIEAKKAARV
ncbi:MAG: DoxX family protein [Synechococcales cyanobacterium RU_4_20]|nr:DoxX family protein [Synechococcales cyanobacterium RU_4_20]NJR68092.1 DoxX family protein [Synechococcales cyanobacterium CRU_2_2]